MHFQNTSSFFNDPNTQKYYTLTLNQFHSYSQKKQTSLKNSINLLKFPNLLIVWTEGKNLSLPDLLSRSLTTATQYEHPHRTVHIPDSISFVMTRNQKTQPIQYHYANTSIHYLQTLM